MVAVFNVTRVAVTVGDQDAVGRSFRQTEEGGDLRNADLRTPDPVLDLIRDQHIGARLEDPVDARRTRGQVERRAHIQRNLSDQPQLRDLPDGRQS